MKNLVIVSVLLALVALILGVITKLVGHLVVIYAAAWNGLAQTLLLFAVAFGVWEFLNKKS